MKHLLTNVISVVLLMPAAALAQFKCPDILDPTLDWDGDGVLNGEDACCFVTSKLGDDSGKVCNEKRSGDMNGNGVSAADEGMCCVAITAEHLVVATPARSYCHVAQGIEKEADTASSENDTGLSTSSGGVNDGTGESRGEEGDEEDASGTSHDTAMDSNGDLPQGSDVATNGTDTGWAWGDPAYACGEDNELMVPCDQLLLYNGMPVDGSDAVADCGEDSCICYTIGDYDQDDSFASGGVDGPFDNCPVTWNAGSENASGMQSDADGDYFGDACDSCLDSVDSVIATFAALSPEDFDEKFIELQCDIGGDDCPGAYCVPRAFENPFYAESADAAYSGDAILVGNFCSAPTDVDKDGIGDECDNCVHTYNPAQKDADSDGIGDRCQLDTDSENCIDACDTDTGTKPHDTEHHRDTGYTEPEDTGAVSFSGGGVISCQLGGSGWNVVSRRSLFALFSALLIP